MEFWKSSDLVNFIWHFYSFNYSYLKVDFTTILYIKTNIKHVMYLYALDIYIYIYIRQITPTSAFQLIYTQIHSFLRNYFDLPSYYQTLTQLKGNGNIIYTLSLQSKNVYTYCLTSVSFTFFVCCFVLFLFWLLIFSNFSSVFICF